MRGRAPARIAVVLALAALCLSGTDRTSALFEPGGTGRYRQFGDAGGFRNILPPGQKGNANAVEALAAQLGTLPPHGLDQFGMYHDLGYAATTLTEGRLPAFFKDASFGVAPEDVERVYWPTLGATVARHKSFGVPHIFGTTRGATMFAQGYTGAEDRLFVMDVLRHVGRARVSEFLGPSAENQALDREHLAVAPYTSEDLTKQVRDLAASGPEGAAVVADLQAFSRGINAFIAEALLNPLKLPAEYAALQQLPRTWAPEGSVAVASYVGGQLGRGGGAELRNLCGLRATAAGAG